MAYMVSITRNPSLDENGPAISLAEWVEAVERVDGVRLAEGDYSVRLPETGQEFTLRNNGGDVELYFPDAGAWRRVFRWSGEDIAFVGTEEFLDQPDCRLRATARTLAEALQASVCGEEGKVFA